MPRIPPVTLNTALYLYRSIEHAEAGKQFGGTGFVVGINSVVPDRMFLYAVTNWHVAVRDGCSVPRVNTKDRQTDTFEFGPEDWHFNPRYDIAVIPLPLDERHVRGVVHLEGFVSRTLIEAAKFGPGEDVYMVGRFIDHDGGRVNLPMARFGNISAMPTLITQPNGKKAETFVVDMHSRPGYSGSPVFVYRLPGYDLEDKPGPPDNPSLLVSGIKYLALLGIHYAQFPEEWEITTGIEQPSSTSAGVPLIADGKYVKGLSGMSCVLPAWLIRAVLDMPKLKAAREVGNERLLAEVAAGGNSAPGAP